MKIAVAIMGDERWMAGEVIVRNILKTVAELDPPDVRLSLVSAGDIDDAKLREHYPAASEYLVLADPAALQRCVGEEKDIYAASFGRYGRC